MKSLHEKTFAMILILVLYDSSVIGKKRIMSLEARADIYPASRGRLQGTILLSQVANSDKVEITGQINKLPASSTLGFHVHEFGDFSNATNACNSAGNHFNPFNKPHGGPQGKIRHVGDLGNIQTNAMGIANIMIQDNVISLKPKSSRSIIGRAFVIHDGKDDFGKGNSPASLKNGKFRKQNCLWINWYCKS